MRPANEGAYVFTLLLSVAVLGIVVADLIRYCSRRRLFQGGDAFRCRIRTFGYTSAIWPQLPRRWSRLMWAAWIGDVLVVWRGPLFARAIPLRAEILSGGVHNTGPREVRRCGSHPIAVSLQVWDGSQVEVATAEQARHALVGPYLAAVVNHRPQTPVSRRQP
jgi:hypothetical protein